MWFFMILILISGIVSIVSPKVTWYLTNWWKFEPGAEPSELSLLIYRFQGGFFVFVFLFFINRVT